MKKILFVLLILLIPSGVYADSVSPRILGYEAVVINKKGAKEIVDENPYVIPYNTKVNVIGEYDKEAMVCLKKDDDCYTISIKDIAPVKKEVVPNDLLKKDNMGTTLQSHKETLFIYGKNGVSLKKGPADAYDKYSTVVPFKGIVKSNYAIHYEGHGGGYTWFYIDEDGYKGWISNEDEVAYYRTNKLLTFKDVNLYDVDTNKVIATIPVETVFDEYYTSLNVYLTYKGQFGYINHGDDYENNYQAFGFESKLGYLLTIKSAELKDANGKSLTAIPKGERIKILYGMFEDDEAGDYLGHITDPVTISENKDLYYIEYRGVKGFIDCDEVEPLFHEYTPKEVTYDVDLKIYDINYFRDADFYDKKINLETHTKNHDTGETLSAGTKVTKYQEEFISDNDDDRVEYGYLTYKLDLIKYGNKLGYVVSDIDDDRHFIVDNPNTDIDIPSKDIDIPTKDNRVMSKTMESIINGIMIALIAASVALSLIKLVNKKRS